MFTILQRHNAALCIHDMIDDHPRRSPPTGYICVFTAIAAAARYAPETLKTQARWIKQTLGDGKDVFAYFNNDAEGHALRNAAELKQYVLA